MRHQGRLQLAPQEVAVFFYFIMGIHGSKAGDSTLSSKVNKQFNKLKKENKAPKSYTFQETSSLF